VLLHRRHVAIGAQRLGHGAHIAALKGAIRDLQPGIDLPDYDIKDVEFAMPAEFDAKKAEGETLVRDLTTLLHRLKAEAESTRRRAMTPDERFAAQEAELLDLRQRLQQLEGARANTSASHDGPVGRPSRSRSEVPQMLMPSARAGVRPTNGWMGAPGGIAGDVQLIRRGTGEAAERAAMLVPGSPHRKAMPGALG
jgi:hypothetical protein